MILSMCEIMSPLPLDIELHLTPDFTVMMDRVNTGWMAHGRGFGKLIELHRPAAYDNEHSRHLLEYNRFMVILASLATGQFTFLSSLDRKTRPWMHSRFPSDSRHKLVDIYIDLPDFAICG